MLNIKIGIFSKTKQILNLKTQTYSISKHIRKQEMPRSNEDIMRDTKLNIKIGQL